MVFKCDETEKGAVESVNELEKCHYQVTISTKEACGENALPKSLECKLIQQLGWHECVLGQSFGCDGAKVFSFFFLVIINMSNTLLVVMLRRGKD